MISDIRMAPMNGMELLRIVHEEFPLMSVVMLTAYGQVDTAIEANELGVFEYVKKPFRTEELLMTIEKALQYHKFLNDQAET
jgi:DNA-binding NtrC family response regulator